MSKILCVAGDAELTIMKTAAEKHGWNDVQVINVLLSYVTALHHLQITSTPEGMTDFITALLMESGARKTKDQNRTNVSN